MASGGESGPIPVLCCAAARLGSLDDMDSLSGVTKAKGSEQPPGYFSGQSLKITR